MATGACGSLRIAILSGRGKWSSATFVAVAAAWVLLVLAPAALAEPPANDNFADAVELSGLPVDVMSSNKGADEEADEPYVDPFAAGHSVWFRWRAPSDGYFLVDSCEAHFSLIMHLFEVEESGEAEDPDSRGEEVAGANADEGTDCRVSGRERIVHGVAGASYAVMIDGSQSPMGGNLETEGTFPLRIEKLTSPANDDFADAEEIEGRISEEPDGHRSYFASVPGRTWEAGREPGEPEHNGNQQGASVWFSWEAPEDGDARVSACCFGPPSITRLYSGDSVDDLTPAGKSDGLYEVSGGDTYWIAVDGEFDADAESVRVGSFDLHVSMKLADAESSESDDDGDGGGHADTGEPNSGAPPAPEDVVRPATAFGRHRVLARRRLAVFFLRSNERAHFICRLDRRRWQRCARRVVLRQVRPGRHVLRARAIDAAGNFDATPAVARFRMPWPSARARARALKRVRARARSRARSRARARRHARTR